MDWDDIRPKPPVKGTVLGDPLDALSVAELEARIAACQAEIERVKTELERKRAHEAAASAFFKR